VTRPQALAKATDERSVVPTTRFKRDLDEREASTPVANQMTVEYLDKDGKKLNLNDVLQGGDGTNIPLKVRVTVPSTSTQTQVKLTLAPFMRFVSTGDQDEGVKKTTIDVSKPVNTIDVGKSWKAPDGDYYYNQLDLLGDLSSYNKPLTYQTGQSVTYRLKENVKVVEIPLALSVDRIIGLKGYSSDGQLPGVSEGVEKATPVTTTLTAVVGTTKETKTTPLNKLAIVSESADEIYTWFNGVQTESQYVSATNDNNYTVVPGMSLGWGNARRLNNYFINHFDFTLRDVFVFMLEDLDIFKLDNEIELVSNFITNTLKVTDGINIHYRDINGNETYVAESVYLDNDLEENLMAIIECIINFLYFVPRDFDCYFVTVDVDKRHNLNMVFLEIRED